MRIADELTRISVDEAIDAYAVAYHRVFGRPIDGPTLACVVAQSALETGNWQSMHCYNFHNSKGAAPDGLYTMFACGEELPIERARRDVANARPRRDRPDLPNAAIVKVYDKGGATKASMRYWPDHPQCKFKAFRTASDGAVEALRFIAVDTTPDNNRPNRYAKAWQAADDDDPEAFAMELGHAQFYTADKERYTTAVVRLFQQYLPACRAYVLEKYAEPLPVVDPLEPPTKDVDQGRVLDLVAKTIFDSLDEFFEEGPPTERNV